MIKVVEQSGIQETYLNVWKRIYSKLIDNVKLNGEKLKAISLKSGRRQGSALSSYLFSVIEVLAWEIQLKDIKGIQIEKKEVKVFVFASDTTVHKNTSKIIRGNSYSW